MTTTINVQASWGPKYEINLADPLGSVPDECGSASGVLTTDHPMSSRGLPVLVVDGSAYGPADLLNLRLLVRAEYNEPAVLALARAAESAGYQISNSPPSYL